MQCKIATSEIPSRGCRRLPEKYQALARPNRQDFAVNDAVHTESLQPQPAVDLETAAGEEIAAEDEIDRGGDLLGLPEPPERDGGGDFRERLRLHAGHHGGANESRRDRADPDVVAGELLGPGDGHGEDAGFGRAVVGLSDVARARTARDIHDDATVAETDHALGGLARAEKDSGQI